jgi:hypothetical protein
MMHKEGQPNQALAPNGIAEEREAEAEKKILTLRSDRARRLVSVALTWEYGDRVIEVYPPLVFMQVLRRNTAPGGSHL